MQNEVYIASTYLKVLFQSEPTLANQLNEILGTSTLPLLEQDFIYQGDIHRIFNALTLGGLDSWLLRYGENLSIASHGALGFAVLSSPDLDTAMTLLSEYSSIRSSTYLCEFSYQGSRAEFSMIDQLGEQAGLWLLETSLSVIQRLIENIVGHQLGDNALISFTHSKPVYAEELEQFYGVKCQFNASKTKISIPKSWCQIPSPLYDEATFKSNLAKCVETKLKIEGTHNLGDAVMFELEKFFNDRINGTEQSKELPSLLSLSVKYGMSSRTFTRKLKEQGSSYKQLLEHVRRKHASALLKDTHLTIADIAYNLAYQESANFVRAFRAWFDTPPATWRRKQHKHHTTKPYENQEDTS